MLGLAAAELHGEGCDLALGFFQGAGAIDFLGGEKKFFFETEQDPPRETIHILARHDKLTHVAANADLQPAAFIANEV